MRFFLHFLLFIFLSPFLSAEKIDFQLAFSGDSGSSKGKSVSIPLEWDESWFGKKSSFEYDHNLARLACYFSDAAYSDLAANPRDNNLFDAYRKLGIKESDIEAHYDINYTDAMWGNDQCAFSIASKKIQSGKGAQTLLLVVIRGTPLNASEWLSNLNINDANKTQESIHKGFARAANIIHTALISYMLRRQINPTDAFLFITGHSRGAAVSNLLSSIILDDNFFKSENMYVYTFAAPNVTTSADSENEKYGFIWNIVNAEDIVPTVPMNRGENWAYKKYGHTLSFSNQTNTDADLYQKEFVPKISGFYEKLSGREYKPFTTGPFVPIVVTKLVELLSENVERYYGGFIDLHNRAANLMHKLFPEKKEEGDEEKPEETKGGFGSWMISWLNRRSNGLLDYVSMALADMHSNDVYLSYMLALSEEEAFSSVGYSLVVIQGYEEFAVFDSDENMMARVIDGKIFYSDTKLPLILCPALKNSVIVGYPSNMDFKIAITDETLLPSPASITVEHFDSSGVFLCSSDAKKLYLRRNKLYCFYAGASLLHDGEKDSGLSCGVAPERVAAKESREIIRTVDLRPRLRFNIIPEVYANTDFNLGFALHVGSPLIFASVMTAQGLTKIGKSGEVTFGLGNQQSIYRQLKFENEIFAKCIWLETDKENDDGFVLVPELRSSLSMKVIGRLRIFSAGVFDFQISDFNDAAFEGEKRHTTIHTFRLSDSLRLAPSIQFGLRF